MKTISDLIADFEKSKGSSAIFITAGMNRSTYQAVEDFCYRVPSKIDALTLLLETGGGSLEYAERISCVLRDVSASLDVIVLSECMSAGTPLSLSGDKLWMDKYAVLGPTDLQYGGVGSSLGYLKKYHDMAHKAQPYGDCDNGDLTNIERDLFLQTFDPAFINTIECEKKYSEDLICEYLTKYHGYKQRESRRIGEKFNDIDHWCTHGRFINRDTLGSKDFGLKYEKAEEQKWIHEARDCSKVIAKSLYPHCGVVATSGSYTPIYRF